MLKPTNKLDPMAVFISKAAILPHIKLEFMMRSVTVASYIPGRIRLYSRFLKRNTAFSQMLYEYMNSFKAIHEVHINPITGSLLITYDPDLVHESPELMWAVNYIKEQRGRR